MDEKDTRENDRRAALFCIDDHGMVVFALDPTDEQEVQAETLPAHDRHTTIPDPDGWRIPEWGEGLAE